MTKVFIDTNVWFSAFYGSPNCHKIIQAHINGKIKAVISQDVLEELVRNTKAKIPQAADKLKKLLKLAPPLVSKKVISISLKHQFLADKKDLPILFAAHEMEIKIFVTGNTKDFKRTEIEKALGIKVLTPKELIDQLDL